MTVDANDGALTVAVAGGKGGCGKTTTAVGIAQALVRRGRRPIVVDADVGVPDLHIRTGVERDPGLPALDAGERLVRVLQPSPEFPGVDVLAAGTSGVAPDGALRQLRDVGRPTLLDCPAGAGPDVAAPLRAAHRSVLVTTEATESRQDAAKTARMADALDAPVAVTVRRERTVHGSDPRRERESPTGILSQGTRAIPSEEIPIPCVADRPLSSERVLDRYETAALSAVIPRSRRTGRHSSGRP